MEGKNNLKGFESEILEKEKEISQLERKIEEKEEKILATEKKIFNAVGGLKFISDGISKFEAKFLRFSLVKKFHKHKTIYSIVTLFSIVMIWKGIWDLVDNAPGISSPLVSILLGITILWFTDKISEVV